MEAKSKTQPSSESQKGSDTVVVKALKEPISKRLAAEGNLLVFVDDTYQLSIVYLYSSFQDFVSLSRKLLKGDPPEDEAMAYSTLSTLKPGRKGQWVSLIWINSCVEKGLTIPAAMHEISHASDSILDHAGVKDSSGEARAYLVEREAKRILESFYGIKCDTAITVDDVMEAIK